MADANQNEEAQAGRIPPPYPLAMVICDAIHRDPATGKPFLLGCFSVIHAREFPATHAEMFLYVAVTNGRGQVPFKIQLIDIDEAREPIWSKEQEFPLTDPRQTLEMGFKLENIVFPEPGEYRFQLFASQEFLMERRVLVNQVQ